MTKTFQLNLACKRKKHLLYVVSSRFDSEHRFWTAKDVETDTVDKVIGSSQIENLHNASVLRVATKTASS